jgi:hypothetical protein
MLERLIEDRHWREADSARVHKYYGNRSNEMAAIFRHWRDPLRQGLLRAQDTSRLIDFLHSADKNPSNPSAHYAVLEHLEKHVRVLRDCGEDALAQRVSELVQAFRQLRKKGWAAEQ